MQLIDSHAHLEYEDFNADRDEMLQRAKQAGVATILTIGSAAGTDRLDVAIPLAEKYLGVYATIGIHPQDAAQAEEAHFDQLAKLARHRKVIAWGEIGIDYHYPEPPKLTQIKVFRRQLELAWMAKLPIIIHCRDAWQDCLALLDEVWKPTGLGGILHCFTSTLEDAYRGIDMGFLVSFTANLTYPKAQNIRDVAKALPLEKVLIETDSPYLAPQPVRGKRNEPAYVAEVAKVLANVRDLPVEAVAAQTTENFWRFFSIARPGASHVGKSR